MRTTIYQCDKCGKGYSQGNGGGVWSFETYRQLSTLADDSSTVEKSFDLCDYCAAKLLRYVLYTVNLPQGYYERNKKLVEWCERRERG